MYAPVGSVNMYEWRSVLYLSVNWRPVKEQAASLFKPKLDQCDNNHRYK